MHKRFIILIVIAILSLILTGCASGIPDGLSRDLMADVKAAPWPDSPDLPESSVRQAVNRFAAELLGQTAGQKGNVVLSPFSVYLALAMTLNGADQATRAAMLDVLADEGITVDQVNGACRSWLTLLQASSSKTNLVLANSIWFDSQFTPEKPFLQTNADFYSAGARQIAFDDSATPGIISDWVKTQTQGKIEKIIESINPNAVMFLINTVFFKSEWAKPFDEKKTVVLPFVTPDGPVDVPMMTRTAMMTALAMDGAAGVVLPYEDPRFVFFALLPADLPPRDWLAVQDPGTLFETLSIQAGETPASTVALHLPQFEVRYENSLVDELATLGMGVAFMPGKADFSKINAESGRDLYIGEVKHKTFIRVDELGTEAAASTAVEIDYKSVPAVDLDLKLDRPFLFGILDLQTRTPLFLGILENPAAD